MEYLEVYLHIIEAIDIKGVERNGNSDPYIQVMAPNEKGKLQVLYKTDTIKNTRNPKYNAELLIRVPSTTDNIVLRVKDWNALLKDKKLGFVVLPLNKIPNHANVEEYPIEEGGGKLKLCTRFIRAISELEPTPVEELPKVRIHLEHYIYHPGEVVRGHLVFNDRKLTKENEKGSIFFNAMYLWEDICYFDIHERFDIVQGSSNLWAFQFLLPKRIPTKTEFSDLLELLRIYINAPTETSTCAETRIIIMPSYEGLEPKFSPRRPEPPPMVPSDLILTWGDFPKVHYLDSKENLKFNLHNSGTSTVNFDSLNVSLRFQQIVTKPKPDTPIGLISEELILVHCADSLGPISLEPSETREFTFVIPPRIPYLPQSERPSAPFEVSGDVYELNNYLEVEGQVLERRIGISRIPIFYTSKFLTRNTPPNYELSMAPDTFWVASVEDPNLSHSLMAPSTYLVKPWQYSTTLKHQVSETVPAEIFSTLRRETTKLPNRLEYVPPLASIFDVPFDDAC